MWRFFSRFNQTEAKKTYLLRNHICAQLERNIERHDFNLNLDFLIEISASNLLFSYDNL